MSASLSAAGLVVLCSLTGCASHSYAGVDLGSKAVAPEVRELALAAGRGDKRAQLALGERYETGTGVPRNLDLAVRLYADAASDIVGTQWTYSPAVNGQSAGTMIGLRGGAATAGLDEARERLERLQQQTE